MQRSRLALRTCKRALSTAQPAAQAAQPAASYQPPVQPGSLPAYDHALAYIQQDRDAKLAQLDDLKRTGNADPHALDKLEVEAWSNDPETRWRAKHGHGELAPFLSVLSWCAAGTFGGGGGLVGPRARRAEVVGR